MLQAYGSGNLVGSWCLRTLVRYAWMRKSVLVLVCVCVGSGRQQFCSNASFRPRRAITGLVGFREQARQMKVPPVDLSSTPEHNAGSWPDSPPPCPYVPGRNSRNLRKRNLRSPIQHVPVRDAGEWHCRRYDPRFPGTRHLTAMGSAMWHFYVGPGRRLL